MVFISNGISKQFIDEVQKCNLINGSNFSTFVYAVKTKKLKSSELHRRIKKNGWLHIRTSGSHYIYEKDGRSYPVPFHGTKEIGEGLRKKIFKEMGLE